MASDRFFLVILYRQDVITTTSHNLLNNVCLAAQLIQGDDAPFQDQGVEKALIATSSLPFPAAPSCPSDTPSVVV